MLLKDRTAIVYGGSGAVGGAVAKAFAREGAMVVLAARRREPLEAVAAEITAAGGRAIVTTVEATNPSDIARHLAEVVAAHGPVRVMFNGISWDDTQGELLTEMAFGRMLAPVTTALTTWFHTGTALARHMAANGGGVILGITANVGRWPVANIGGFGVACAAVENFLRQLAIENGPEGVRVCWVRSPGSPDAPGVREAWQLRANEMGVTFDEVHAEFAKSTPLRRITALAQVAGAVTLLGSDLAAGMTATMANATGGGLVD
jgi:7-alpha-hydroxysteroid dehydrogenase